MDLRRPVVLLAVLGSLVGPLSACSGSTDLQRGETNCDASSDQSNNAHDASCEETGGRESDDDG